MYLPALVRPVSISVQLPVAPASNTFVPRAAITLLLPSKNADIKTFSVEADVCGTILLFHLVNPLMRL